MPDINNPEKEITLEDLYTSKQTLQIQSNRFRNLTNYFNQFFNAQEISYFSSPGRIEVGGNHTDHNNGCILASAIDIDTIAVVSKNNKNQINLVSRDLNQTYSVNLDDLEVKEDEKGKTSGLIRGIAAKFSHDGLKTGGFDCALESNIGIGSGLSSSASIEVLIGTILSELYNESRVAPVEIAKYGQYAENNYFGKPCGLMDQLAIAVGGIVTVDFQDKDNPVVEKLNINFSDYGFAAVVVNTGGTHADLTDDYAAIPFEMKSIAGYFGKNLLRFIKREEILENLSILREKYGDRAVLRAMHFLDENDRVSEEVNSLKEGNIQEFLSLVKQSGDSSARWLQNIYSSKDYKQQSISIALELTEYFLKQNSSNGVCRVHGGGFAGTILTFVEEDYLNEYIALMNNAFGADSALKVSIRNYGTCRIII